MSTSLDDEIVKTIKDIRIKLGLTQQALAGKAQVSMHTVQNWEYGKTVPKRRDVKLLIKSLALNDEDYPELFFYAQMEEDSPLSADEPQTAPPLSAESAEMGRQDNIPSHSPRGEGGAAVAATDEGRKANAEATEINAKEEPPQSADEPQTAPPLSAESAEMGRQDDIPLPSPRGEGGAAVAATDEGRKANAEASTETVASTIPAEKPLNQSIAKKKPLHPLLKTFLISAGVWLAALIIIVFICLFNYATEGTVSIDEGGNLIFCGRFVVINWLEAILCLIVSFAIMTGLPVIIHIIIRRIKKT